MLVDGSVKLLMAEIATMITTAADTKPASTAACPKISAPTMETAGPIALGIRIPASRNISKASSITNISTIAGKGTRSL